MVLMRTHAHPQQYAVVMISTGLAPPYCKQGGVDRLPALVTIISFHSADTVLSASGCEAAQSTLTMSPRMHTDTDTLAIAPTMYTGRKFTVGEVFLYRFRVGLWSLTSSREN